MIRLSGMDNMFLKQESKVQPQHTIKAVVLDPSAGHEPITFDKVRATIPAWLEMAEPLRWALFESRTGVGRPWWISRPEIDMDYHVKQITAPAPGGDIELSTVISEIIEGPLRRGVPFWQLYYVDGLADGRVGLVLKLHHSLADGMASLRLLETIFCKDPDEPLPVPTQKLTNEPDPSGLEWYTSVAEKQTTQGMKFPNVLARSGKSIQRIRKRQKEGRQGFAEAFRSPAAPFNDTPTERRSFAYVTYDLATIKRIGKTLGGTVNDVFLTAVGGATREYLKENGTDVDSGPLTAVVPVAIRPPGQEISWGNMTTTWFLSIATDIADPVERLRTVSLNTKSARSVHDERDLWLFGDWMEYWPLFWFYGRAMPIVGAKLQESPTYSLIASNVPGPKDQLYLGGAPIEKLISVGPIVFPYGLNFTGWSYQGEMVISMQACGDHVPDMWEIASRVPQQLDELAALASAADVEKTADAG